VYSQALFAAAGYRHPAVAERQHGRGAAAVTGVHGGCDEKWLPLPHSLVHGAPAAPAGVGVAPTAGSLGRARGFATLQPVLPLTAVFEPCSKLPGLVTLGVGDTCASVVGFRLGRHRWFAHWPKSVEGTVAGILASFCCCVFFAQPGAEGRALVACVGAGCLEAFTAQLDNAFVPLHFFVLAVAA
jgi:hypothetical protein